MPKDAAYFFKHDSNAHNDLKIKRLVKRFGWQGYGWWWLLVEIIREEDGYSIPYDDDTFEVLASEMLCEPEQAKTFVDSLLSCKLLQRNGNGNLYSDRLNRDMLVKDNIKEQARLAAESRWLKQSKSKPRPDTTSLNDYVEELRPEYLNLDLDAELEKFNLYWSEGNRTLKRPKLAFRNWLDKAIEIKQPRQPKQPDDGLDGYTID